MRRSGKTALRWMSERSAEDSMLSMLGHGACEPVSRLTTGTTHVNSRAGAPPTLCTTSVICRSSHCFTAPSKST